MRFDDDEGQAEFRRQLRAWIADSEAQALREEHDRDRAARPEVRRRWLQQLYRGGWLGVSWPRDVGGRGLSTFYEHIVNAELGMAGALPKPYVSYLGWALITHGSDEQKQLLLPGLLSGEEGWCQGFSEPNAGSDLAGLQLKAVATDGGYLLDGQKIWTSDAAEADRCLVLARTDPTDRYGGITAFVVPMDSRGIEIRPIRQITGDSEFCEVFYDGVEVPENNIVGGIGAGWQVAMTVLRYERAPEELGFTSRFASVLDERTRRARSERLRKGVIGSDVVAALGRNRIGLDVLETFVLWQIGQRTNEGQRDGVENSMLKLFMAQVEQSLFRDGIEYGPGELSPLLTGDFVEYLYSRAESIMGGTSQIQKNIIASRVLGMPRQ